MADLQPAAVTSLEVPTMVGTGSASPVMAIIEVLNSAECRMRSVNVFAVGAPVEFSLTMHGSTAIPLRGTIASGTKNGPRFSYVVTLHAAPGQTEAIAHANEAARSRAARAADIATNNGLTRSSVRIPVDFELRFTDLGGESRAARAINISTGGLHMNTLAEVQVGTAVVIAMLLDTEPVKVHGRIVAHQAASPNYNVAFYDVDPATRERIAQFIDAHS